MSVRLRSAHIADDFRTVVDAVETSSENLEPGKKILDVWKPLYAKENLPAFEAVQNYECAPGGG